MVYLIMFSSHNLYLKEVINANIIDLKNVSKMSLK